jgi:hypothetical protein
MPPRAASEGLDFTPILTHYLFLFTTCLAVVSSPPFPSNARAHRPTILGWLVHGLHRTMYRYV